MATTPKAAAKPKAPAKPKATEKVAAASKAAIKPKTDGKPNALQQPLTPSAELAEVVGKGMLSRGQVVSKVWEYIREHKLQNPADKRNILADAKLKKIFGKDEVTMFEMNKYLAQHLK